MTDKEIIIKEIINTHEKYKNAYFWSAKGTTAQQRRSKEFDRNYKFQNEKDIITVRQRLEVSCRNYYYSLEIYVNDSKKDIRVLKKILGD